MSTFYIYDFDLIDVDGDGTSENPWMPGLMNHAFLQSHIESWTVIDDGDGLMVTFDDDAPLARIAQRYRERVDKDKIQAKVKRVKENPKRFLDRVREKYEELDDAQKERLRREIRENRENLSETEGELQRNPRRGLRRT